MNIFTALYIRDGEHLLFWNSPPSCSDLTCHPGHHTDQIATLSNIVFYFSCLLLSVVTSKTKAAKNICWALDSRWWSRTTDMCNICCWALEATSVNPLQLQRKKVMQQRVPSPPRDPSMTSWSSLWLPLNTEDGATECSLCWHLKLISHLVQLLVHVGPKFHFKCLNSVYQFKRSRICSFHLQEVIEWRRYSIKIIMRCVPVPLHASNFCHLYFYRPQTKFGAR